jgi:hypothetical protein
MTACRAREPVTAMGQIGIGRGRPRLAGQRPSTQAHSRLFADIQHSGENRPGISSKARDMSKFLPHALEGRDITAAFGQHSLVNRALVR